MPGTPDVHNGWMTTPTRSGTVAPFRVVFVCAGNICRSPMGEIVLREALRADSLEVEVLSAGVSDEEAGNPIDRRARRVLESAGYQVHQHTARRVRPGELASYHLVLARTAQHQRALYRRAELDGVDPGPIRLWREFDPAFADICGADLDVPDPWYGGHADFVATLGHVEAAVPGILAHLRALG